MSSRRLDTTIRGYQKGNAHKSYMRPKDAAEFYGYTREHMMALASAAGAVYRLPKIVLICRSRLEDYMNHMEKVPGTGKYVNKVFVRAGEGSILYSIGRNRFIEMARDAGAVYKLSDGMVLIHLDTFDEYMEKYHQERIPLGKLLGKESK